jgi:ABC-type transporter Mla subunit MlaD
MLKMFTPTTKDKSLDSIISTFNNTLADLDTFVQDSNEEKKVIEDRLEVINSEVSKAQTIQTNLKQLLGE